MATLIWDDEAKKICRDCKLEKNIVDFPKTDGKYTKSYCKLCWNIRQRAQYKKRPEEKVEKRKLQTALTYQESREIKLLQSKMRNMAYKMQVIQGYGNQCACCGENNSAFLTIDHINGGGSAHRRTTGHFYRWLIKNNFPKDNLQLLCMNCNWAKRFLGQCPHQQEMSQVG